MHDTQTLDDGQEGDDQVEASQQAMKDSGADQNQRLLSPPPPGVGLTSLDTRVGI